MNAEELLAEVEALGVTVHREGDVLKLRPGSAVPPALVEELRAHKAELLELVDLRGWPEASRECVREFRLPEARLYPFLGSRVATPEGDGHLLEVLSGYAVVELDSDPRRVACLLPSEVRPPDLAADLACLPEVVH